MGPGHPLAGRSNLLAADLAPHSLYLREPGSGTRACIEQAYATLGLEVQARMSVGSSEALKRLVAGGQGIAWLSEHAVEAELAQGRLLRLDLRDLVIERDLHVLWRATDSLSPAPAAFLQDLLDAPGNIKTF